MELKDPTLLRQQGFLAGQWRDAQSGSTTEIRSPADGALVGSVPRFLPAEVEEAIAAAEAAITGWRQRSARDRGSLLKRWAELIVEASEDLAQIMTAEQGKPLAEAKAEIAGAAGFVEWFAEEGRRAYGEVIPAPAADRRAIVLKGPVGVVAAITPWNFPSSMITRKCAPALAAGCTVVLKPAPQTPFSALALAALAERAGMPEGVISIVTGDAEAIGPVLTSSPVVRKLSFTGSTAVGKRLMADCAGTVKKVSLELGGHAPVIVFEDADIDTAVAGVMAAKFRNAGQACVGANRLYLHEKVHDAFLDRLAEKVAGLVVGKGSEPGVTIGPLISSAAVDKVERHVRDALDRGARLVCGGKRHSLGGNFFEPTVLADVSPEMQVSCEETFGPVLPVSRFTDETEVVRLANDTAYGLSAYFFTSDHARVWRLAERLDTGIVGVNVGVTAFEAAPFGGVKESGIGREGGHYGLEEYLETKYVCLGGLG